MTRSRSPIMLASFVLIAWCGCGGGTSRTEPSPTTTEEASPTLDVDTEETTGAQEPTSSDSESAQVAGAVMDSQDDVSAPLDAEAEESTGEDAPRSSEEVPEHDGELERVSHPFWETYPGSYMQLRPCDEEPLVPFEIVGRQWRCSRGDNASCAELAIHFDGELSPYGSEGYAIPEEQVEELFVEVYDPCSGPGGGWAGCSYVAWDSETQSLLFDGPRDLFELYLPQTEAPATSIESDPVRQAAVAYCSMMDARNSGDNALASSFFQDDLDCLGSEPDVPATSAWELAEYTDPLVVHALVPLKATADEVVFGVYLFEGDSLYGLRPLAVVLQRNDSNWRITAQGSSDSHACFSLPRPW